ncbi:MAG TPA: ferritin family protein [Candidatus Edwardsbacteria bacterium]|nr:ferritin family protein [Candidatus Edwardsbacteria bacterium]
MPTTVKKPQAAAAAIDALNKAIHSEQMALATYLKFARQTKVVSGKDMFIRLSEDELGHREILEKELGNLQAGKPWCKPTFKPSDIEELLPKLTDAQAKAQAEHGSSDDLSALNIALDMEKKAMAFYRREADKSADATARKMYARLAEMEEAHYNLIQAEIDNIKDMGFWFGIQEFTLESNE